MHDSPWRDAPATHPVRAATRLLVLAAHLVEAAHAGEKMDTPVNSLRLIEIRGIAAQLEQQVVLAGRTSCGRMTRWGSMKTTALTT